MFLEGYINPNDVDLNTMGSNYKELNSLATPSDSIYNPNIGKKIKRNVPPMDATLQEIQSKITQLPNEDAAQLLSKDWYKSGFGVKDIPMVMKSMKHSGVGVKDAMRYYNHIKELGKQGYTFADGGELQSFDEGTDSKEAWMLAHGYKKDRYGTWRLSPTQREDRTGGTGNFVQPNSPSGRIVRSGYLQPIDQTSVGDFIMDPVNAMFGSQNNPKPFNPQHNMPVNQPIASNYNRGIGGLYTTTPMDNIMFPQQKPIQNQQPTVFEIPKGPVLKGPVDPTQPVSGKGNLRTIYAPPSKGTYDHLNMPDLGIKRPNTLSNAPKPADAADVRIALNKLKNNNSYDPVLSPLGHIASAAANLADYSALKKAKPLDFNLPRVGAERISLANQRLANERNAATSRAVNATSARGLGLNAGQTMANTASANTGVNRLLGQQNAELLAQEENTNAQLRQQANSINAELGAQESVYNTQAQNAYRMALAQNNPLGMLGRTVASYAKDNAAYGQGYDTLQMLAPNAELYGKPDFLPWLAGKGPKVRLRDKNL